MLIGLSSAESGYLFGGCHLTASVCSCVSCFATNVHLYSALQSTHILVQQPYINPSGEITPLENAETVVIGLYQHTGGETQRAVGEDMAP